MIYVGAILYKIIISNTLFGMFYMVGYGYMTDNFFYFFFWERFMEVIFIW